MSTRSIILVTGNGNYGPETYRLYKHSDGYPTDTLDVINRALERAIKEVASHNARFKGMGPSEKAIQPGTLTGFLLGEATHVYGMGASIEKEYQALFSPVHLGNQGDLEWIYLLDTDKQTLSVYGGGYTGVRPQLAYNRGKVDPLSYVEALSDEYRADEHKRIAELVQSIQAWGFKLNPDKKPRKALKAVKV